MQLEPEPELLLGPLLVQPCLEQTVVNKLQRSEHRINLHWLRPQLKRIRLPPMGKPCILSIALSASAFLTNWTKPQFFPAGTLTYSICKCLPNDITYVYTYIMYVSERRKEGPQGLFRYERRQSSDEYLRMIYQ